MNAGAAQIVHTAAASMSQNSRAKHETSQAPTDCIELFQQHCSANLRRFTAGGWCDPGCSGVVDMAGVEAWLSGPTGKTAVWSGKCCPAGVDARAWSSLAPAPVEGSIIWNGEFVARDGRVAGCRGGVDWCLSWSCAGADLKQCHLLLSAVHMLVLLISVCMLVSVNSC